MSCRHLGVSTLMGECATGVKAMTRSAGLKVQDSSGGRALLSLSQPSISSTAQRPQHPIRCTTISRPSRDKPGKGPKTFRHQTLACDFLGDMAGWLCPVCPA